MISAGNREKPFKQKMINFLSTSWEAISEETINNNNKKKLINVEWFQLNEMEARLDFLNSQFFEVETAFGYTKKN